VDKPDPKTGQLELFPRHFFLVTSWAKDERDASALLQHYRARGTFEIFHRTRQDAAFLVVAEEGRNPRCNRKPLRRLDQAFSAAWGGGEGLKGDNRKDQLTLFDDRN